MPRPRGLQQSKINGHDLVGPRRKQVAHKAMTPVSSILGNLTALAAQDPLFNVCRYTWPIAVLPDQLSGPLYALVAMLLMKLVQDLLSKSCRHKELEDLFPPIGAEDPMK